MRPRPAHLLPVRDDGEVLRLYRHARPLHVVADVPAPIEHNHTPRRTGRARGAAAGAHQLMNEDFPAEWLPMIITDTFRRGAWAVNVTHPVQGAHTHTNAQARKRTGMDNRQITDRHG